MKRILACLLSVILLCGCTDGHPEMDYLLQLRSKLQQADSCSFTTRITADYGNSLQEFSLNCSFDDQGNLEFTVAEPDTIKDISGKIVADSGKIIFDDTILLFETVTENQIAPVTVPWILMKTLRSGYITAAGMDDGNIHATINDTYREQALELDIWFDESVSPIRCDILWMGTRVLSADVENFIIL